MPKKISFFEVFQRNNDGSLTPTRVININGIIFGPGIKFGKGVSFGGVNLFNFQDYDIGAEEEKGILVMAGGRGTRLLPLTETLPKPMLSVAGRPILERIILHLLGFGIKKIYISINYLGHKIKDYFQDCFQTQQRNL